MKTVLNNSNERFPVLLRGAWFGINKAFRSRLKLLGLTTTQFTTLRCIEESTVINQAELAKKISTNKNNSSALIKRLHRLKLIKKQVSPKDRRISLIELTEKGHSLFLEAEKIADEVHSEVINELPPGSEGELIELLSLCTNNLTGKKNRQ